jgi:hypothetical protein
MNAAPRLLAALLLVAGISVHPTTATARDELRPAVGKPLQQAQKLIQARKFKDALGPIAEAEKAGDLTAYEAFVVTQMKGAALAGAGDADGAAAAFEKVLAAKRLPRDEQLRITEAVAGSYLRAKNYPKAIQWIRTYQAEGGARLEVLQYLPQAYYQSGDYLKAAQETATLVEAAEKAGASPSKDLLILLASSQQKQGDMSGYTRTLEKLVRHHPAPEYWAELIHRTANQPGVSRNLELDRYRLLRATGNLGQARDYMEAAQLAMQAGLPGEAKSLLDEGFAKQVLGSGDATQTERQNRLRALVEKKAAEDRKSIAGTDADAAKAAGGDPLVKTGLAYVSYGEAQKGLAMMEQGLRKGGLKFPEQSRLRLGYAYYVTGDKARAQAALRQVGGTDGAADFARLWSLLAAQG